MGTGGRHLLDTVDHAIGRALQLTRRASTVRLGLGSGAAAVGRASLFSSLGLFGLRRCYRNSPTLALLSVLLQGWHSFLHVGQQRFAIPYSRIEPRSSTRESVLDSRPRR